MNKQAIRSEMRKRRASLSAGEQESASCAAAQRIFALPQYRAAKTVMAYVAARGELSLAPVIEDVLASGRTLCLPRCEDGGRMTARAVRCRNDLVPGAYGLLEPREECPAVQGDRIDLALIPGTAFGRDGSRIGQGGGYYDRFLPGTRAYRVGVCHDFALFEHLPRQAHDEMTSAVITPGERILTGYRQEETP